MHTITPEELKKLHPKRFEKEYYKWVEYATHHDWGDWIKEDFGAEMKCVGIHVDNFWWDISYSQGDGASFDGHVKLHEWMADTKAKDDQTYAELYPALYLACKQDGSYISVSTRNRGHYLSFSFSESWWGTDPEGIFTGLDRETWVELVEDQASSADLEDEIRTVCERFMKDMYYKLRDEYEEITSEDAFVASCEANGITFEVEGEDDYVAA